MTFSLDYFQSGLTAKINQTIPVSITRIFTSIQSQEIEFVNDTYVEVAI
jgi:hypothetical protein